MHVVKACTNFLYIKHTKNFDLGDSLMNLKQKILTYEKDGKIVANLFDYYDTFISTLDKQYEQYSYYRDKLVLCFFKDHEDVNPSMGYIKHKSLKGVLVCHCFGCGKTADVVRLHQILRSQYQHVELSEKEACIEIANMFNIPIELEDDLDEEDYEKAYERRLRRIDYLSRHYTVRDFSRTLLDMRKSGNVDLNKVNSECVKMIATSKQLYD